MWYLVLDQRSARSSTLGLVWRAGGRDCGGVSPHLVFPQRSFGGILDDGPWVPFCWVYSVSAHIDQGIVEVVPSFGC